LQLTFTKSGILLQREKTFYITSSRAWPAPPPPSVPTKILVFQRVPKKSAALACLTMAKLKMNQRVPNKNAFTLKKKSA